MAFGATVRVQSDGADNRQGRASGQGTASRRSVPNYDGQNSSGTQRVSTDELVDFVKERALRKTIKEVQVLTGLSEKAVKNMRLGSAGASAQTISTWCRNDPRFRAEYFAWCGGYLETDPEMVANLSRVLTDYARRLHVQ